jgi:hypothetical protein
MLATEARARQYHLNIEEREERRRYLYILMAWI